MQGKIMKGIAGFYYVDVVGSGIYECKAKGIFRKEKKKPLVGDNVEIAVLDEAAREGNLVQILPRKNELIRPAVANVDQALIIFAMEDPKPNYMLLDRFLIMMEMQKVPAVICMNKTDLGTAKEMEEFRSAYEKAGYKVVFTSVKEPEGLDAFSELLKDKTTVVAGQSGVGKSSLINQVQKEISMETGETSKKLGRGRHTTRHSQLIRIDCDTYIMDTPGFSSLDVDFVNIKAEDLRLCFPEFHEYEGECRFLGCSHTHEPGCAVKAAPEEGKFSGLRYQNYITMYKEQKEREKRRY